MRIAVYYSLPTGGAKRSLHDQVRGLVARGHEVSAWHPPRGDDAPPHLDGLVPTHVVPVDDEPPPWWSDRRSGALRSPRGVIAAALKQAQAAAAAMNDSGADVHLVATDPVFGSPPVGRFLRGPRVLYLQEPHRWLYEAHPEFPWVAARPEAPLIKKALDLVRIARRSTRARFEIDNAAAFDRILVNSRFSRETVARVYGVQAHVCYLGIDTAVFKRTRVLREPLVAGVGNLVRQKRAAELVAAVGRIRGDRPSVRWLAAAIDDGYEREIRALAQAVDVDLTIEEAASDEDLVNLLNRAQAVVYTPRLEPFGLVPLEANACGAAVVGIAEGGIRETIVHEVNGLLVDSLEDELAQAIERLLREPALAARLGEEGHQLVGRRWTIAAASARLEQHLLAAGRGAGQLS